MGNYTILGGFENPRRGRQARNFTTTVSKFLDTKSSSEQIFSTNYRWVPLKLIEFLSDATNGCLKRAKQTKFIKIRAVGTSKTE